MDIHTEASTLAIPSSSTSLIAAVSPSLAIVRERFCRIPEFLSDEERRRPEFTRIPRRGLRSSYNYLFIGMIDYMEPQTQMSRVSVLREYQSIDITSSVSFPLTISELEQHGSSFVVCLLVACSFDA